GDALVIPVLLLTGLAALYLSSLFHYVLVSAALSRQVPIRYVARSMRGRAVYLTVARLCIIGLAALLAIPAAACPRLLLIGLGLIPALLHRLVIEFMVPLHHADGTPRAAAGATFRLLASHPLDTLLFLAAKRLVSLLMGLVILVVAAPVMLVATALAGSALWVGMMLGLPLIMAGSAFTGAATVAVAAIVFMLLLFLGTWLVCIVSAPGLLCLRLLSMAFLAQHDLFQPFSGRFS
ncbi:hypothetical protein JW905_15170, partial [bacterium]|nr:hypothetical protein [candidate division CSSED10-310 bacterium]